jgi:hypothetical protein
LALGKHHHHLTAGIYDVRPLLHLVEQGPQTERRVCMATKPHPARRGVEGEYILNVRFSPQERLQLLRLQDLDAQENVSRPQSSLGQIVRQCVYQQLVRELERRAQPELESCPWTEELCRLLAGLGGADPLTEEQQRHYDLYRAAMRERVAPAKKGRRR